MANLIIKPSAGGQLIIKDEGDDAAITVATNGTTTFAENTTLSGTANNLGTTTAGTLSSGVTFPSGTGASHGHVLQVVYGQDISAYALATSAYTTVGLSAVITPLSATNKVLVTWTMHANMTAAERGYGVKLLRDDGGGYDTVYTSPSSYNIYNATGSGDSRMMGSWAVVDTPGVIVATTYNVQVSAYLGNAININESGSMSYITLMEVVA